MFLVDLPQFIAFGGFIPFLILIDHFLCTSNYILLKFVEYSFGKCYGISMMVIFHASHYFNQHVLTFLNWPLFHSTCLDIFMSVIILVYVLVNIHQLNPVVEITWDL